MATIRAQIIEGMTGEPLPGASVQIVDSTGKSLQQGVMVDQYGRFILTSDILMDNFLLVTYTGLVPVLIDASMLNNTEYKEIQLLPGDLPEVVVTPGGKTIPTWLFFLLGGVGLYAWYKMRKAQLKR
jgi:hypothetical protein